MPQGVFNLYTYIAVWHKYFIIHSDAFMHHKSLLLAIYIQFRVGTYTAHFIRTVYMAHQKHHTTNILTTNCDRFTLNKLRCIHHTVFQF